MPTTYTDISYDSTTQTEALAGFGIMCDNTDIYCNSGVYYCDGVVVQIDASAGDGVVVHMEILAGYGIMYDNTDIYYNSEAYYCDGSVVQLAVLENQPEIKWNNTTIKMNDRWTILINGSVPMTEISYP